jgi:hypothetical protein
LPLHGAKLRTSARPGLDSQLRIAERISQGLPPVGEAGEGASVNPRLVAALTLLACLLGIFQPALAYAPVSDCCSSDCNGQPQAGSSWVEISGCCAIQAPAAASLSIAPQTRQALNITGGSPALITLADDPLRLVPAPEVQAAHAATRLDTGQSLIYLRTARLRL